MISDQMPYQKHFQDVDGKRIAYVDQGEGDPIVLLHGNPTSSYLWRNVIPELVGSGRVIAPDLIGMGQDHTPLSTVTLAKWADQIAAIIREQDEPVVLASR